MKKKSTAAALLLAAVLLIPACTEQRAVQVHIGDETQESRPAEEAVYEGMLSELVANGGKNTYDTLNVATYITKVEDTYFIADCYHNQIIYNQNLTDPLSQWRVLTNEVHYAHTIASDGVMLLADDTENNRLLAFQRTDDGYVHTQTLENIGMRPHYVQYDAKNQVFMAWSSITGEMYLIKKAEHPDARGIYPLYVDKILKIDELYVIHLNIILK